MITTLRDFEVATAFERFALAESRPLVAIEGVTASAVDLRTHVISISGTTDISGTRVAETIGKFRPLLVGAAWKVLDVAVELSLHLARLVPAHGHAEWSIEDKARRANAGSLVPLSGDVDVWPRLAATYANLREARHCLVHRAFAVGPRAELTALVDRAGVPVPDVTAVEQDALLVIAQRVAEAVLSAALPTRGRLDLLANLDVLATHHALPVLGGARPQSVLLVVADAQPIAGGWRVEPGGLLAEGQAVGPGRFYDLELHFPGSGHPPLRGEIEAMPPGPVIVDPRAPPAWLHG